MKRLTNSIRTCRLVVLAVVIAALLFTSATPALAAGKSDEVLLANSLEHYIQALIAYNDGDLGEACGQLQAAASNAKHVDPDLADLLGNVMEEVRDIGHVEFASAQPIAIIYNSYNDGSYPMFDPSNPTSVPPGEGTIT